MNRKCAVIVCRRDAIPTGARCDQHTRIALTGAFGEPEWVRRAREHRLPVRIENIAA
jgi:hypothetical protein